MKGRMQVPKLAQLKSYRLLVTTCTTSGLLSTMGLEPGHFTHVLIDEAGEAMLAEAMVPLSLAADNAILMLAGDSKQLGPVVRSAVAKSRGLQVSLLEVAEEHGLSAPRPGDGAIVPWSTETKAAHMGRHLCGLRVSYRAHPSLLTLFSAPFYDSTLQPGAALPMVSGYIGWSQLLNPQFPAMFEHLNAVDARDDDSPSWFNMREVDYVKKLVDKLLSRGTRPKDIGIITPFQKQVHKIRAAFGWDRRSNRNIGRKNRDRGGVADIESAGTVYTGIRVGTVEKFQGMERHVIIIST
ncbi:hypothetical protein CYMTET_31130, partial [Cymbomonas tetramitiformis]